MSWCYVNRCTQEATIRLRRDPYHGYCQRHGSIMRRYGLDVQEMDRLQDVGFCNICNRSWWETSSNGRGVIDHCHQTLWVRGVLCRGCNLMLGAANDNTETLANAIRYLRDSTDWMGRGRSY